MSLPHVKAVVHDQDPNPYPELHGPSQGLYPSYLFCNGQQGWKSGRRCYFQASNQFMTAASELSVRPVLSARLNLRGIPVSALLNGTGWSKRHKMKIARAAHFPGALKSLVLYCVRNTSYSLLHPFFRCWFCSCPAFSPLGISPYSFQNVSHTGALCWRNLSFFGYFLPCSRSCVLLSRWDNNRSQSPTMQFDNQRLLVLRPPRFMYNK